MDWATLFLWFLLYSFVGWVYESILCSILEHKPVNRGFLTGPICPIYGTGAIVIIVALSGLKGRIPLLFLSSAVISTAIEYATSWLMEELFHARWWDYSDHRFNLNGRVCLLGFVAFGAMAVLVLEFVQPWVSALTAMLDSAQRLILAAALGAFFAADLTLTLISVLKLGERLPKIQAEIGRVIGGIAPRARLESLVSLGRNGLHAFQLRRLSLAFPKLHFTEYHESWQRVKKYLMNVIDDTGKKAR